MFTRWCEFKMLQPDNFVLIFRFCFYCLKFICIECGAASFFLALLAISIWLPANWIRVCQPTSIGTLDFSLYFPAIENIASILLFIVFYLF